MIGDPLSTGRLVTRHVPAPAVGAVEVTTAEASVATHNRDDGHETPSSGTVPSNGGRSINTGADHVTVAAIALEQADSNPITTTHPATPSLRIIQLLQRPVRGRVAPGADRVTTRTVPAEL